MRPTENLLFDGIDNADVTPLVSDIVPVHVAVGDILFSEGDSGECLYLLLSGSVRAFVTQDGHEITLAVYRAGMFFGELAILSGETRSASVAAVEAAIVLPLTRTRFAQIAQRYPRVIDNVSRVVVRSLIQSTRSLRRPAAGEVALLVVEANILSRCYVRFVMDAVAAMGRHLAVVTRGRWVEASLPLSDSSDLTYRSSPEVAGPAWFHFQDEIEGGHVPANSIPPHLSRLQQHYDRVIVILTTDRLSAVEPIMTVAGRVFLVLGRSGITSLRHNFERRRFQGIARDTTHMFLVGVAESTDERRPLASMANAAGLPLPSLFLTGRELDHMIGTRFRREVLITTSRALQHGPLRLARALAGMRVGVAFGAGGARGFAHVGVQRYLEELHLPIDVFAGSSIGSLSAAMQAMGLDSRAASELLTHWLRGGYRRLLRPRLSRASIFSGAGLDRVCRELFGQTRFIDLPTPLAVAAADLVSGVGVTLDSGAVYRAVRASCSIPAVFPPVRYRDRLLVDGGVTDPVPVRALEKHGADITVAVNISLSQDDLRTWSRTEGGDPPERLLTGHRLPNFVEAYHASFSMSVADKAADSAMIADVAIRPRFRVTSWRAFSEAPEQVQRGYDAAVEAEGELRRAIPWLNSSGG